MCLCTAVHISHPELCRLELSSITAHHHRRRPERSICLSHVFFGGSAWEGCAFGMGVGVYITYYSVQKVKVPASSAQTSSTHCHWLSSIYISAPPPPPAKASSSPQFVGIFHDEPRWRGQAFSHNTQCCHKPKVFSSEPAFVRKTTRFGPLPFLLRSRGDHSRADPNLGLFD